MREGEKPDVSLSEVWRVMDKLKSSVQRLGLNLYDHFRRFDPNQEDLMSEYLFRKVMLVCLRNEVPISEDEMRVLVEFLRYRDGRVFYSELCDRVHDRLPEKRGGGSMVTGLEWEDPGHVNALKVDEQRRLDVLLERVAEVLAASNEPLEVHLREYEQVARSPGCVSWDHLARVLKAADVRLVSRDFNLMVKRYSRHGFMVNFVPLLEDLAAATRRVAERTGGSVWVDSRYYIDTEPDKVARPDLGVRLSRYRGLEMGTPTSYRLLTCYPFREEGVVQTMRRIKKYVLTHGLDLTDCFQELDPMRRGTMSADQFRRALCSAGINSGMDSKLRLDERDVDTLVQVYRQPLAEDAVMWRLFVSDVDHALIKSTITPELTDKGSDLRYLPYQGNVWDRTPPEVRELCEEALERMRRLLASRRWSLEPLFRQWDPSRTGHVNLSTARSILSSVVGRPRDLDSLEKRYADAFGFDYLKLTAELRLSERPLPEAAEGARPPPAGDGTFPPHLYADTLRRARRQVLQYGRKLDDYLKQFDPLRRGSVSKSEFLRALTAAKVELSPAEGEVLSSMFRAPLERQRVDYARFLATLEEAQTQPGLEKQPLVVPVRHVLVRDDPAGSLSAEERRCAEHALDLLSDRLTLSHLDEFRELDPVRSGTLDLDQFVRVLGQFKLRLPPASAQVLLKAFGRQVGRQTRLEYLPLLKVLDTHYKDKHN